MKPVNHKILTVLHLLKNICLALLAAAMIVFLGKSRVTLDSARGEKQIYYLPMIRESAGTDFEDSYFFNRIYGNSVADIVRFGVIKSQLETDGQFDPDKEIDVAAYAGRFQDLPGRYLSARYRLGDLLKWQEKGFEGNTVSMTEEEWEEFFSDSRSVAAVKETGSGGKYLNTDPDNIVYTRDISGNMLGNTSGNDGDTGTGFNVLQNRYKTVDNKNLENCVTSKEEYEQLRKALIQTARELSENYEEYNRLKEHYDGGSSNLIYAIYRNTGKHDTVISNTYTPDTNPAFLKKELIKNCSKYSIFDQNEMDYETNTLIEEATMRHMLSAYSYSYPEKTVLFVGLKKEMPAADVFSEAKTAYDTYASDYYELLGCMGVTGLLWLLLTVLLTIGERYVTDAETGEKRVCLKREDTICTEIILALLAAIIIVLGSLLSMLINSGFLADIMKDQIMAFAILGGGIVFCLDAALAFLYFSLVRRGKAGMLWKTSLLYRILHAAAEKGMKLYDNSSVIKRVILPFVLLMLMNLVPVTVLLLRYRTRIAFLLLGLQLALDIVCLALLYRSATEREKILDAIRRINAGSLHQKIDETGIHGDNLVLAREVNGIGDSIRTAVNTSMKDERMKADLITNVSHDLKTPLTSIINYIDLIKRENIEDEKVREYIGILDQKSQRLKQLTDDLVEASKISSGTLILSKDKINLIELLNQTIGEFSEKFAARGLTAILQNENGNIQMEADARRIWRVMENLFNNIHKYAMQNTRVYIDVEEFKEAEAGFVSIQIKNISEVALKVSAEELTERFIRGDESRTTEGSGLGLSIAKNLTEAMQGEFKIAVDGDLFKVTLIFPTLQ